jgi:hypothetical protein
MTIYIVTDQLSGQRWAYTSAPAMLMHIENPLNISSKDFFALEKGGYPVESDGCSIDCIETLSMKEVRIDNPSIIE